MFWSWLLAAVCAGMGIANVARGVLAILVNRALVQSSLPFWLLGGIYCAWGLVFLTGCVAAGRRSVRARRDIRVYAVAYQVTVWVLHFVGDVSTYARGLWLRDLVLSLLFLIIVFLLTGLSARNVKVRQA